MAKLNNLAQRVLTGVALLAFVLYTIFWMPSTLFVLVSAIIFLLAAWEWTTLASLHLTSQKIAYVTVMALLMWGLSYLPILWVVTIAALWWLSSIVLLLRYPQHRPWQAKWLRAMLGGLVLLPAWDAIVALRLSDFGSLLVMGCLLIIISADTGAYFTGRAFGRHKILPLVSPGKSWEGWMGGLLLSWLLGLIVAINWAFPWPEYLFLFCLIFLINIFALTGDLLESMLKRHVNIKDSGRLLPGHGGLLDRMDSVTAATPIFLLALLAHHYH